jgi:hypothetical protein
MPDIHTWILLTFGICFSYGSLLNNPIYNKSKGITTWGSNPIANLVLWVVPQGIRCLFWDSLSPLLTSFTPLLSSKQFVKGINLT